MFYEDTLETDDQYVPVGKASGQKGIIKSPTAITGFVLGVPRLKTWDNIKQKMGKRHAVKVEVQGKGKGKV